jgi:hypothetical protein
MGSLEASPERRQRNRLQIELDTSAAAAAAAETGIAARRDEQDEDADLWRTTNWLRAYTCIRMSDESQSVTNATSQLPSGGRPIVIRMASRDN